MNPENRETPAPCCKCGKPSCYLLKMPGEEPQAICADCTDWRPGDGRMEREAAARLGMSPYAWAAEQWERRKAAGADNDDEGDSLG